MTVAGQAAAAEGEAARQAAIASGASGYYDRGKFILLGPSTQEKQLAAAIQTGQGFGSLGGTTVESRTAYARSLGFSPTEVRTARGELPFGSRRAEKQKATQEALQLQREERKPVTPQQQRYDSLIQSLNERERGQAPRGALTRIGEIAPQGAGFSVFKIPERTKAVEETFSPAFARKAAQAEAQGDSLVLSNAFGLKVAGTQEFRTPEQRAQDNKEFLQRQIERTASFQKAPVKQLGGIGKPELQTPTNIDKLFKAKEYGGEIRPTRSTGLAQAQKRLFGRTLQGQTIGTSEGISPLDVSKVLGKGTLKLGEAGLIRETEEGIFGTALQTLLKPLSDSFGVLPKPSTLEEKKMQLARAETLEKSPEARATGALGLAVGLEAVSIVSGGASRLVTTPAQAALYGIASREIVKSVRGQENFDVYTEAQRRLSEKRGFGKNLLAEAVSEIAADPFSQQRQQFETIAGQVLRERDVGEERIPGLVQKASLTRQELAGAEIIGLTAIAERGSELFGRAAIKQSFKQFSKEQGKKFFSKPEALKFIQKRTASKFLTAGVSEGLSQTFLTRNVRGEKITGTDVLISSVVGGKVGKFLGIRVAQSAIRPVRGGAYNVLGNFLDFPTELGGDIAGDITEREISIATKKAITSPAVFKKGVSPAERYTLGTIREGVLRQPVKVRAPSIDIAGFFGGGGGGAGVPSVISGTTPKSGVATFFNAPVTSRAETSFKFPTTQKQPVPFKEQIIFKEQVVIKEKVTTKQPITVKEPITTKQPTIIKEPVTFKQPITTKTPVATNVFVPRFPIVPPILGGGEFSFNRESIGRGRKGQYQASFFGVALGKRVKNIPLGASFSGFEIRGIPGGTSKSFKQPKPFTADVNKDLFSKGLGNLDINLAGKSFGGQKKGKGGFGGLLNVGFGKRSSKKKSNKLFRRNLGKGFRL